MLSNSPNWGLLYHYITWCLITMKLPFSMIFILQILGIGSNTMSMFHVEYITIFWWFTLKVSLHEYCFRNSPDVYIPPLFVLVLGNPKNTRRQEFRFNWGCKPLHNTQLRKEGQLRLSRDKKVSNWACDHAPPWFLFASSRLFSCQRSRTWARLLRRDI